MLCEKPKNTTKYITTNTYSETNIETPDEVTFSEETQFDSLDDAVTYVHKQQEKYDPIHGFIETHSKEMLTNMIAFVPAYATGAVTYRTVAGKTGIPSHDTFEALTILTPLLVGRENTESTTSDIHQEKPTHDWK